jgi:tetratricopeptide (TPR) repeat protein
MDWQGVEMNHDADIEKGVNEAAARFRVDNPGDPTALFNNVDGKCFTNKVDRIAMYQAVLESLIALPSQSFVIFAVEDVWSEGLFTQFMINGDCLTAEIMWLPSKLYNVAQDKGFELDELSNETESNLGYARFHSLDIDPNPEQLAYMTEDMLISATGNDSYKVKVETNVETSIEAFESDKTALDLVQEAQLALEKNQIQRADELFLKSIDASPKNEAEDLARVLGEYGKFLITQNRINEASGILEKAITLNTEDITVWYDYLGILNKREDLKALSKYADLMAERLERERPKLREYLLVNCGREAYQEGRIEFAQTLFRMEMTDAAQRRDKERKWAAAGALGELLESKGQIEEAVRIWSDVFQEGSNEPDTSNRLTMYFERSKQYEKAVEYIRSALTRGLPAKSEEQLRKRLSRCEYKISPSKEVRAEVLPFSERLGEGTYRLLFHVRMKPPISDFAIVDHVARCLGSTKGVSSLLDIDLDTGKEVRSIEGLPGFIGVKFAPNGYGIGLQRNEQIGNGSTLLRFIDAAGTIASQGSIPDSVSQIAYGPEIWYVGCRDGQLYGFNMMGKFLWSWEVPGSKGYKGSPYFRPYPYFVVATNTSAIIGSMNNLYSISSNGTTLWHTVIPSRQQTREMFSIPTEERSETSLQVSFVVSVGKPNISFIVASGSGTLVGSSQGCLYRIDNYGRICEARSVGTGIVYASLHPDGSLGATLCDEALSFFSGNNVINVIQFNERPREMKMLGENIVLLGGKNLDIVNELGQRIWSVEFSRSISGVAVRNDTIICAAGDLEVFRRT